MSGQEPWSDHREPLGPGSEEPGTNPLPAFLLNPWGIAQRRWPWMLAATALGLVATAVVFSTWKLRYEAEAKVVINSQQIPKEFVRSTVVESSKAYLNAAVGKVLSRANLSRIIDEVGLYENRRDQEPREALIERMRGEITVEPERSFSTGGSTDSSIVYRLAYEGDDPEDAAAVANALAALLREATLAQRSEQAKSVTRFLKQALHDDEHELRAQSERVAEFRREHRGELPSDLDPSMKRLELLHERRADLSSQIARAQSRLEGTDGAGGQEHQTENEILLEKLRQRLATELAANTEDHPNVIALRRQVRSFEKIVAEERAAGPKGSPALAAQQQEIELMRKKLKQIDTEMDDLSKRVDRIPVVSEELAALEQKETVLREGYLNSMRKVKDAELAETLEVAQQGAQIEILEKARPPGSPKRPRWLALVAGVALSLGLGVGVGALLELVDPVVLVARQLEQVVERPVLGSLPRVSP